MSPVPSPIALRRTFARALFSPAGLLFAFVVLLITTCPGARGESGFDDLLTLEIGASSADLTSLSVPAAPASAPRVIGRSKQLGASSSRRAAPAERGEATLDDAGLFRHSRTPHPLLVDPLLNGAVETPVPRIRAMTGPSVGIQP